MLDRSSVTLILVLTSGATILLVWSLFATTNPQRESIRPARSGPLAHELADEERPDNSDHTFTDIDDARSMANRGASRTPAERSSLDAAEATGEERAMVRDESTRLDGAASDEAEIDERAMTSAPRDRERFIVPKDAAALSRLPEDELFDELVDDASATNSWRERATQTNFQVLAPDANTQPSLPAPSGNEPPRALRPPAAKPAAKPTDSAANKPPASANDAAQRGPKKRQVDDIGEWLIDKSSILFAGGFYFGNEITFLSTSDPGVTHVRTTNLLNGAVHNTQGDSGIGTGYRLILGTRGPIVGMRARYWTFAEERIDLDNAVIGSSWPDAANLSSTEMSALDMEFTQLFYINQTQLEASFGMRYASYQGFDQVEHHGNLLDSLEVDGIATSYRSMNGYGPTFSLSGRRPLPRLGLFRKSEPEPIQPKEVQPMSGEFDAVCLPGCGWNWYWSMRGSALWGETHATATTESQVFVKSDGAASGVARSRDQASISRDVESSLLQGELGLGLEYKRPLCRIPGCLVARAGLEYQYWQTGRGGAQSNSYAFLSSTDPVFGGRVDAWAAPTNRYVDLFGLQFSLGINY